MFMNEDKKNDKSPDRNGYCDIACPECGAVSSHWVSGWVRISQAGKQWMSMKFNPKKPPPNKDFADEDVPF